MKVKIDKSKCMGCGSCAALMPEAFEMGPDLIAQITNEYIDKDITDDAILDRLRMVKDSCPNGAIILE